MILLFENNNIIETLRIELDKQTQLVESLTEKVRNLESRIEELKNKLAQQQQPPQPQPIITIKDDEDNDDKMKKKNKKQKRSARKRYRYSDSSDHDDDDDDDDEDDIRRYKHNKRRCRRDQHVSKTVDKFVKEYVCQQYVNLVSQRW